jgi:hypothetical protein
MYFEDLSPYCYYLKAGLDNVLNVGWLDAFHPFNVGDVSSCFLSTLCALAAEMHPDVDIHVNRMRCIHPCNLCGEENLPMKDYRGRQYNLGMSEICIPGDGLWYAAPSMVLHYIEVHRYSPPTGFIAAVERMKTNEPYKAQDVYHKLMAATKGVKW